MLAQMARLNEPTAPVETIESLKRKFMRQNRDIARANSTQSLRIRSLENETSKLAGENLGLRSQILRLQNQLENSKAQRIADQTETLKSQLESKLLEIGALVAGLGEVPSTKRRSSQGGKLLGTSPRGSPDSKNWKNICSLSEALGGEGRLPPILENKTYPRRSLEPQEILNLNAIDKGNAADSPDIGPPPVSQFVDEDPVKIDLPVRAAKPENVEIAGLDPVLSINLEHRRKRKDSALPMELKPSEAEPAQAIQETTGSLKIGAKRKLNHRDDDENDCPSKPRSPDEFQYSRVGVEEKLKTKLLDSERPASRAVKDLAIARGASTSTAARKILAPKSVNSSPRKTTRVITKEDLKRAQPEALKSAARDRAKEKKAEAVRIQPTPQPQLDTAEVLPEQFQSEPETPAALDIFSPSSSQPSTTRVESRDTPPPVDIGSSEGARPSRRARGAVSYAEPNLRDKMRRPTKTLVDAVTRDGKPERGSAVKLEEDVPASAGVGIKIEPEADDAWKQMPTASGSTVENSPLSNKAPELLPSSITTNRKRRESLLGQNETEISGSGSTSAIATLLAESRKARAAAKDQASSGEMILGKDVAKPDIYEFRGSSPSAETATKPSHKEEKTLRSSRRHSSVPRDITTPSDGQANLEVLRKRGETSNRQADSTSSRSTSVHSEPVKEPLQQKTLKRNSSTNVPGDSSAGARSERISARRKSMML